MMDRQMSSEGTWYVAKASALIRRSAASNPAMRRRRCALISMTIRSAPKIATLLEVPEVGAKHFDGASVGKITHLLRC